MAEIVPLATAESAAAPSWPPAGSWRWILWLLGALGTVSLPVLSRNAVHVLLVVVIIIVVPQLLRGRRP